MKRKLSVIASVVCFVLLVLVGVSRGDDWEPMTSGTTNNLNGIWGTSSTDVYAVGSSGTILHYNGSAWSAMTSGTMNNLSGIWGSSSSDVFAVGSSGTILHYNGSVWSAMTSGTTTSITGIWGSSSSDVFAVGYGMILRYDGSSWTAMDAGSEITTHYAYVFSIWGTSSTNVMAAAYYPAMDVETGQLVGSQSFIVRYDGSAWSTMVSSGSGDFLQGIWGSSSSDVFAVGKISRHYDGSAWSTVPGVSGSEVWGSSSSDVFVLDGSTIRHFDGSMWSSMVSGTSASLGGIWGASSTDVFAVGSGGTILHRRCTASTPDQFVFLDRTGADLSRPVTAAGIQVSAICAAAPISIAGGEYSINGGGYTNIPGMVNNGSTVRVRMDSSASPATTADATLTIGDRSDTFSVTTQGAHGEKRKKNDFDGDGCSDIGCYYPTGGNWYLYRSHEGYWETRFGFAETIPVTGDFDGDGLADFGCYYDPLGKWYIYKSTEGFWETQFGYEGTLPIVGDFDGDGRDDFGCYYAPSGKWYIYKSTEGFWETQFGYDGTVPLVGDFDGDGRDDIGCFDQQDTYNGYIYLFRSTEGFLLTRLPPTAEPVVGDFDGDGRDDVGVYTAFDGEWDLIKSSEGLWITHFGYPGTIPLGYIIR